MRCVDCELHDRVVGTHFCNYRGKSGRRRPRRISEEDAYKDVPCEYVEGAKGADDDFCSYGEREGNYGKQFTQIRDHDPSQGNQL